MSIGEDQYFDRMYDNVFSDKCEECFRKLKDCECDESFDYIDDDDGVIISKF